MQEEVENRTLTLVVSGTKFTGRLLKAAISKYLAHRKEKKLQKQRSRDAPVKPQGKQTVKQLIGQNQGVSNIEITDPSIKEFEKIARKYGVDYAVKKDRSSSPPKYLIFFKGRDADALTAAFTEYTGKKVRKAEKSERPSVLATVPIDDGVKFQLKSISEIMDEAEYPGIRVSMSTTFDGVVTPLKIDISTGDAITPREVRYSFKLMLEDRSIDIWAYNLETVLAEKLETIITRTTTNTRMRDFYDIYILEQLHGTTLNPKILHDALLATAHKRGSEKYLNQAEEVFDEVENDSVMQKLWEAYRKKFSYASDLEWDVIMKAIRRLYVLCEKGISL